MTTVDFLNCFGGKVPTVLLWQSSWNIDYCWRRFPFPLCTLVLQGLPYSSCGLLISVCILPVNHSENPVENENTPSPLTPVNSDLTHLGHGIYAFNVCCWRLGCRSSMTSSRKARWTVLWLMQKFYWNPVWQISGWILLIMYTVFQVDICFKDSGLIYRNFLRLRNLAKHRFCNSNQFVEKMFAWRCSIYRLRNDKFNALVRLPWKPQG